MVGHVPLEAGKFTLKSCEDELLVIHERSVQGYWIQNIGEEDLVLFKYFGPDINHGITPPIGHLGS